MEITAPLSLDQGSEQVEHMMNEGVAFTHVEDVIDAAHLPKDHKAALWLLAWSLQDPMLQRRDARLTLSLVSEAGWRGR